MNANFQQLENLVRQNNGHLYDYAQDGFIVTNVSGKEMLQLPAHRECRVDPQDIERVKLFFSDFNRQQISQRVTVEKPIAWIDIRIQVLSDQKLRAAFSRALKEKVEHYSTVVRIHFDKDSVFWQDLLSSFSESFQEEIAKGSVSLQLYGTFDQMEESVMEFLFNNRIQIYYVSEAATFSRHNAAICSLAEYGFRVPCVWYVDNESIHLIPSLISEAMEWNYDAGFSLPLASERVFDIVKDNPANVDYLRLIIDVYKKYQCYDGVFYPMNMVLMESIGVTHDSKLRIWRWDDERSSLYEHFRDPDIDKIHKILRHSFVWQRHIVQNKLESLLPNDCSSAKNVDTNAKISGHTA